MYSKIIVTIFFLLKPYFPSPSPNNSLGWYFKVYSVKMPFGWLGGSHSKVSESSVGLIIFKEDGALGTFNKNRVNEKNFEYFEMYEMTHFTMFTEFSKVFVLRNSFLSLIQRKIHEQKPVTGTSQCPRLASALLFFSPFPFRFIKTIPSKTYKDFAFIWTRANV